MEDKPRFQGTWGKGEEKMEHQRLSRIFVSVLLVVSVSGCAYPISQHYREEAKEGLTFPTVLKDPTAYAGSVVLWGGTIIDTVTLSEGSEIFVLQTPLDYREKPEADIYSQGRFIARSSSFLDPEIYKNGRRITLAGEITGKVTLPLGKSKYTYPVVAIKELHLWKKTRTYIYPYPYYGWYYGPGWGWGWYGPSPYWPYWGDWDEEDED
jgi:outer membrane lipoprotein